MKKIIATVLAMVMALALCATAFAASPVTVKAKAVKATTKGAQLVYNVSGDIDLKYYAAEAATLNSDGEQTNVANIAYYTIPTTAGTVFSAKYVVVSSLGEADIIVYSDLAGKNVMLYLAAAPVEYNGTGTVFTNFGAKCGQVNLTGYDKAKTYYTSNEKDNTTIYVTATATEATEALMVGGKLVNVKSAGVTTANIVPHAAIPTVKDGKVVGYTCATCKLAAVEAPNYASIPANNSGIIENTNWYFPAVAASTTTTTSSPKTFDAGIAMYVGMALTSVAGSAVVIGKKKEF